MGTGLSAPKPWGWEVHLDEEWRVWHHPCPSSQSVSGPPTSILPSWGAPLWPMYVIAEPCQPVCLVTSPPRQRLTPERLCRWQGHTRVEPRKMREDGMWCWQVQRSSRQQRIHKRDTSELYLELADTLEHLRLVGVEESSFGSRPWDRRERGPAVRCRIPLWGPFAPLQCTPSLPELPTCPLNCLGCPHARRLWSHLATACSQFPRFFRHCRYSHLSPNQP